MLELTYQHIIGILLLLLITLVGGLFGKKVKTSSDFAVGGKKAGEVLLQGP